MADLRRQYETNRKREYRKKERLARGRMREEIATLQKQLQQTLQLRALAPVNGQQAPALAQLVWRGSSSNVNPSEVLNEQLRTQVQRHRHLLKLLHEWTLVNTPLGPVLEQGSPYLHSTLLAAPVARELGLRWLTDRIFHSTLQGLSFDGNVDDTTRLEMMTDGLTIFGMDTYTQMTFLADVNAVAKCIWDSYNHGEILHLHQSSITCKVEDSLMYKRMQDSKLGTSLLCIVRRYYHADRVVIVTCLLRDDDCYPLHESEMRPHGMAWLTLEKIASGVTLYRGRSIHYSPVTCHGVIDDERMAAMFGVQPHPTSRDVTLARIESHAARTGSTAKLTMESSFLDRHVCFACDSNVGILGHTHVTGKQPTVTAPEIVCHTRVLPCEKREYRAKLRDQRTRLRAQVAALEQTLATCRHDNKPPNHVQSLLHQGQTLALGQNRKLRGQVYRHYELLQSLHHWAILSSPIRPPLAEGATWRHSTLVADPIAREYGYRWLTDRAFHSTREGLSFDGNVDDVTRVEMLTDGANVMGMDSCHQTTVMANFNQVARIAWAGYTQNDFSPLNQASMTLHADDTVIYKRVTNTALGTSMLGLVRRYDEPDRVVIVMCMLTDDESFPLEGGEMRPHGFGWLVLQHVADDITLYRSRSIQYSPMTTAGVISLEKMAQIFGVDAHPRSRDATMARIETIAAQSFESRSLLVDKDLADKVARLQVGDALPSRPASTAMNRPDAH
ncbi:Aste57867_20508 [Aphanomyces stellatus]|uniref:Aste57867_20508 protein n=1 Tax=Aphanomyces stellatus TaxID=120398 RepID=A0A485LF92_9STRA|nr:hypothetical protein As57867_020442 [Aphanomyces stellatus]VFT97193.1 Aste57867_20508 [Aphanomyces stellatus]